MDHHILHVVGVQLEEREREDVVREARVQLGKSERERGCGEAGNEDIGYKDPFPVTHFHLLPG